MKTIIFLLLASCAMAQSPRWVEVSKWANDSTIEYGPFEKEPLSFRDWIAQEIHPPADTVRWEMPILGNSPSNPVRMIPFVTHPPHDWCWSDTTEDRPEEAYILAWDATWWIDYSCSGICRVCLAETTAVWSYAEDEDRKAAANKLTEYEMLKARKK